MGGTKYSREVRLMGYCILALEALTLFTWGAAFYGNAATLATTALSSINPSSAHKMSLANTTTGVTLTVPIQGVGFFPVTVTASAQFMNGQNQTVSQVKDSVTVSPGEIRNLTITIPVSLVQPGTSLSSALSGYHLGIDLQVTSLYNLVALKGGTVIEPSAMGGGSP